MTACDTICFEYDGQFDMVLYRRSQRLCLEVSRTPVKLNERLYGNSWADAAFVLMSGIFTFLCALWGHRLPLNYANEVTVSLVSVAEHYSMYKGGFSQMDWDSHMWTAPTHCLIFSPRFSVTSSPPQEHFCVLCVSFFLFFFFFLRLPAEALPLHKELLQLCSVKVILE